MVLKSDVLFVGFCTIYSNEEKYKPFQYAVNSVTVEMGVLVVRYYYFCMKENIKRVSLFNIGLDVYPVFRRWY